MIHFKIVKKFLKNAQVIDYGKMALSELAIRRQPPPLNASS